MPESQSIYLNRLLRKVCVTAAILCWVLLFANAMWQVSEAKTGAFSLGTYLNHLLATAFVLAVFVYQRANYQVVRSSEFIQYLLKLLVRSGVLSLGSLTLFVGYIIVTRFYIGPSPYLLNAVYLIFFASMTVFFAKVFVAWKRMILFHLNKSVATEWEWFEILLLITLVARLLPANVVAFVFYPLLLLMILYAAVISLNLKWVAYLNVKRKWKGIFILVALLLCNGIFLNFFIDMSGNTALVLDLMDHPFVVVMAGFISLYCLLSLLVALFNIPTTDVFEQKREDILNFQRLSQSIQMGKDERQVYETLFDSAIKAAQADGGWLEVIPQNAVTREIRHRLNVTEAEIRALNHLVEDQDIGDVDYLNNDLSQEDSFADMKTHYRSFVRLLLSSNTRHYGTLYLLKEIAQGFEKEQINVLNTFVSQTLVSVDNFRLVTESIENEQYKKELNIAARIQDSLLPKTLPGNIPLEVSIFNLPAKEVGGDFYDFHEISDDRLAIIIGDVSGKGISAAFYMAQMKGIFQALMQLDLLPDKFMSHANKALSKSLERNSFITASVFYIDYKMKGLSFARAGHCHTLYHNCSTNETFYFKTEGLGLGIVRDERYEKRIKRLHYDYNPNDVMVLYTDGITEARNAAGEEYGDDRLLQQLGASYQLPADEIRAAIVHDLQAFCGLCSAYDDQTLVVLKFK